PPRPTTPPPNGRRGAQPGLPGGGGTVPAYPAAARRAGLDFLVFLEDFAQLDAGELEQLKAACRQYSDSQLTLYPGYRIDTNTGNHLFLFGTGVVMPPSTVLTQPDRKRFMLQGETAPGVYGITPT